MQIKTSGIGVTFLELPRSMMISPQLEAAVPMLHGPSVRGVHEVFTE